MPASSRAMITKGSPRLIIWLVLCGSLYLTSRYNYTLFHVIAETFSIVIACSLFLIAWNTRHLTKNNYILFLSIALLFAGIIDFVHTLAFRGMEIFRGFDANLPTQLWILARYMQSLSLLAAPSFIDRKLYPRTALGVYLLVTLLLFGGRFFRHALPRLLYRRQGADPVQDCE